MKSNTKKRLQKAVSFALLLSMLCQGLPAFSNEAQAADGKITPKSVTAKSESSHGAQLAVDGNKSTYWQSIPSGSDNYTKMYDHNRYIDITLDGTYTLSGIKIYNVADGSYNNYYVYTSVDGVDYDKVVSKTSDTAATADGDSYTIAGKEAAYVRLNMAYNSNSFTTNLAEIELYGTKTSDQVKEPEAIEVEDWEGSSWQKEWDRFESDPDYAEEKVLNEMSSLVGRVLGDEWKDSFTFQLRGSLKDENDIFELKDGADGTIVIRGNNGIAMASGFNYYLKNYVNIDYNPIWESNTKIEKIVPVGKTVVKEAQFDLRYALNFCTYSYSMAFWNWDEYEKFIDWCAMNSINLVLDIVGQEEVLRQTFREYGYTDEEIKDYICGPAYFAWFYMQNLYSTGGPLPNAWFEQRAELGRKMHDRMQTYGISPVIQGFAGQVPETFPQKNEGAVLTPVDGWSSYTRPSIIKTYLTDDERAAGKKDYFSQVAATFYEKQKNVFGDVSDYYATDPFHEGGELGTLDIATIFKQVQDAMMESDPDAVWVIQHWQDLEKEKKMSEMDRSHTLSLDLQTDMNPQYGVFEKNGGPWLYCMLHNFGGRMGMDGEIPVISSNPIETAHNTKNMKGIGITPEGLENSPVVYELLFETVWSKDPVDYNNWLEDYAVRRAGGTSDSLQEAWDILLETAYADKGITYQGAAETVINAIPRDSFNSASTWGHSNILYDKKKLDRALLLLTENYEAFSSSPAFRYDLADVAEQVLCNAAVEYHQLMVQAKNEKDTAKFEEYSTKFLNLIDLSDKILSTTKKFMLGTWIEAARKMIVDADDWTKDLFEFNARSLVTTWGGERAAKTGGLNDYSNRKWAGLTKDFYKERWAIWVRNRLAELKGQAKNAADQKAESDWVLWEYRWVNLKSDDENGKYAYSTKPSDEDLGALAEQAYEQFSYTQLQKGKEGGTGASDDVAAGKLPTSASQAASGELKNITDNDKETGWTVSGTGDHTVEIDLQGTYEISEIILSTQQIPKTYPYAYKVEVYDPDQAEWVVLEDNKERKMGSNATVAGQGTASKVRVTMSTSDAQDSPLMITEIAVYGKEVKKTYVNLAKGITAESTKADKTDPANPLSYITDGSPATFWKTTEWVGNGEPYPADVTVTLPQAEMADYIEVYFEKAGLPFIFDIRVTDDTGKEEIVFDRYSNKDNYPTSDGKKVMDAASYRIDVAKKIKSVRIHMTDITGEGDAYVAGPGVAEVMIMAQKEAEGETAYPQDAIHGITATGGGVDGKAVDGDTGSYAQLTEEGNAEVTFDLGKDHFVDHADITFEKGELSLRYKVVAVDAEGTQTTVLDKSDTTDLLGSAVVTVPVKQEARKLILIHMGNSGEGPAYLAERRLYEFEAFGAENVSEGAQTSPAMTALTDAKKATSSKVTANTPVTLTLSKECKVSMVSALKKSGETGVLKYLAEYYDETGKAWKTLADMRENNVDSAEVYGPLASPVSAKQVRFTFSQGVELAELRVYAGISGSQAMPLAERIAEIRSAIAGLSYDTGLHGSYTTAAKTALEQVLSEVEEAMQGELDENAIEEQLRKVDKAYHTFKNSGVFLDRTGLLAALSDAERTVRQLSALGETAQAESLKGLYDSGRAVYDKYHTETKQADIDAAKDALEDLLAQIGDLSGDKSELQDRYEKYARRFTEEGFKEHYTAESWNAYENAMKAARNLLDDPEAAQEEIDAAYAELKKLHDGLIPASKEYQEGKDVYKDVKKADPTHWFYDTVMEAYHQKIMTGKGDGTSFQPNVLINRAEVAIVLHRLSGLEAPKGTPTAFVDTTPERLYETARNAIAWASTAKTDDMDTAIVTGFPERNAFDPQNPITRQQMATMLYRYAQYMGYDTSMEKDPSAKADWNDFTQEEKDGLWESCRDAMQWCVAKGIISGDGGRLNGNGQTNRATAATMLVRFAEKFEN